MQIAGNSISIMAGCGINKNNAIEIIENTRCVRIHISGKSVGKAKMITIAGEWVLQKAANIC